jgi:AcrR family transcriptional regulator
VSAPADRRGENRKAQRTLARLVQCTGQEIAESGSFSAERVAARAGTSVATFYSHLPTKDVALTAAFEAALDDLVSVVDARLTVEALLGSGLETLANDFVDATLAFFAERSLVFRCALARIPEHRPLRETYRAHQAEAFSRYARFVELGQAAGKIRAGDPEALARAFLVLSQGLNNPLALGLAPSDPLRAELAGLVVALLAPGSEASG